MGRHDTHVTSFLPYCRKLRTIFVQEHLICCSTHEAFCLGKGISTKREELIVLTPNVQQDFTSSRCGRRHPIHKSAGIAITDLNRLRPCNVRVLVSTQQKTSKRFAVPWMINKSDKLLEKYFQQVPIVDLSHWISPDWYPYIRVFVLKSRNGKIQLTSPPYSLVLTFHIFSVANKQQCSFYTRFKNDRKFAWLINVIGCDWSVTWGPSH